MIALSRPLTDDLSRSAAMHSRLCPRQVIGVRMARLACALLGIDPAIERKQVFIFMECGRCAADAVIAVTGSSPTNLLMQLMDYGKVAATFVNLRTREALRVSENPRSRQIAVDLSAPGQSKWQAQLESYQTMPDESLLCWQPVRLSYPLPMIPDKHATLCDHCGDRINEHCEVTLHGQTLCKACAFGAYYQPLESESGDTPEIACQSSGVFTFINERSAGSKVLISTSVT